MERPSMTLIFVALFAVGSALNYEPRISPPLHDGDAVKPGEHQSDKKFFGPPFPADYPEDKRPVPDQKLMDKLKGPGQPYPALQSKEDYDSDYVKDENSDTGAWQAQFEYDALRKKLAEEEAGAKRAQSRADREGKDLEDAQRDADAADQKVRGAEKGEEVSEEKQKTAEDFEGPPSAEKLEELKKAVDAAEKHLEERKTAFEKCKQQLEDAKKDLEDLKAAQVKLEEKLAADTKLYVESKANKFNLKKTRQSEAVAKVTTAQAKLAAAEKVKAAMDKELAKQKGQHEAAQANLHKEKADYENAQKKLDAAGKKLQKIHGYNPSDAPAKSGSQMTSVLVGLSMIIGMQMF